MKIIRKTTGLLIAAALVFFSGYSMAYAGDAPPGAPWFSNASAAGRYEYDGTLYLDFVDSGRRTIPGGIGNELGGVWREEIVYINFLLVLYPTRPGAETLFFSGTGRTCEPYEDPVLGLPICSADDDSYYELFYLPGDYVARIGAAALGFYRDSVFPALCGSSDCGDLKYAPYNQGTGNADEVVNPAVPQPSMPWYWAQPVTLVTR